MAPKREHDFCPEPRAFTRWYKGRVKSNLSQLAGSGKSLREGFCVTEAQVNRRFKLRKDFEPGDIVKKLQACGIPAQSKAKGPNGLEGGADGGEFLFIGRTTERQLSRGRSEPAGEAG